MRLSPAILHDTFPTLDATSLTAGHYLQDTTEKVIGFLRVDMGAKVAGTAFSPNAPRMLAELLTTQRGVNVRRQEVSRSPLQQHCHKKRNASVAPYWNLRRHYQHASP